MKVFHEQTFDKEKFYTFFRGIPKAELHLHLEAVISKKTIHQFYLRRNPAKSESEVEAEVERLFTYSDLNGFIQSYLAVQDLYDSVDDFDLVFADLESYLLRNGISYAEIFVSPSAFIKKGFDFAKMTEAFSSNIKKIKNETGINVRILIDVSRTFGCENAENILQLVIDNRIPEIIGIGLGGAEQQGPAKLFGEVFQKARDNGLATVAHAGEDVGPESVWDTVNILHASRIGHGISSVQDEKLMRYLADQKIPLEICPTSNVFTKKYVSNLAEHPAHKFFTKKIPVTINTDDPLFFGVELLDEYWNAYTKMGFSILEIKEIIRNSFKASFLTEMQKSSFLASIDTAWESFNTDKKTKGVIKMSFVKRSLLMIGTPVAVFFVITTIILGSLVSNFTELQAYRLVYSNVRECVQSFEKTLSPPSKMIDSLGWIFKDGFYRKYSDTNEIFENMSLAYSDFPGFYGCKPDGTFYHSVNIEEPDGYDPTETAWYQGAVDYGGEIFYSDVAYNELTRAVVVTISRAIFKESGKLVGVVAFDFPIVDLQNFVGEIRNDELDQAFILSPHGDFFMHDTYTPDDNILTVDNGAYSEVGDKMLMTTDDFVVGKVNGIKYVFRIAPIPLTGWYYVLGKSVEDVNAFSSATKRLLSGAFFLLFVVIMGITAFIISRMRAKERGASVRLIGETHNLAVSSKENAATAQEQSTAVKEIVATMEDTTALSEDISQKIKDVSGVASKTSNDVNEGVSYLEENVRQLHEIAKANQATISGIKNLGDKIENIWDIVTLINSVADQAKIIAFNAELEASTAGAAGRNFHIVATEIRRLADGIIDGTKEIKAKITEIQQSSDSLILASESGTEKIQEGVANAKNLEERFTSIKNASEITADSAGAITTIIQQQTVASEQILLTLKQIASGVENFTSATTQISVASETLKSIAEDLKQ